MFHRRLVPTLLSISSLLWVSCGNDSDMPILAGNAQSASAEGETVYQKALAADQAGKTTKAIKAYDEMATRYPFSPSAAKARYRQAELLDQAGQVEKAFDAYGLYVERFPGSGLYTTALSRQAALAQSAADGNVKSSFLGIKSKLSLDKVVAMLEKVRDHAPKSAIAAKAQFTIGQLYESKHKTREAVAAYRRLVTDQPDSGMAPEALFRVGVVLMDDTGNQNQANVDLAREAFNDYLIQYPGHSRNADAERLIKLLHGSDLERSFEIAEFYLKTGKIESAKVYYRDILKHSGSGKLHDSAQARLKELGE